MRLNKGQVSQPFIDNNAHHAHEQGEVASGAISEPQAGVAAEINLSGVSDDECGSISCRPPYPLPQDGVRGCGVGSDGKDACRTLDVIHGVGHSAGAKALVQGYDGWGIAEASATVDVVAAHHDAGKFLKDIVVLVGALDRGDEAEFFALILG
ncbi:hypothetical protein ES703_80776 [subsurface metagenome]